MATHFNATSHGPTAYKVAHLAERDAKPCNTNGHTHRHVSHDIVATSSKHYKTSQWPIVDLMSSQAYSYLRRAESGSTTTTDTTASKSNSLTQGIVLSADAETGKRVDLYGYNMPQSLVAQPSHTCKDMDPMERFLAETHGLYKSNTVNKKSWL